MSYNLISRNIWFLKYIQQFSFSFYFNEEILIHLYFQGRQYNVNCSLPISTWSNDDKNITNTPMCNSSLLHRAISYLSNAVINCMPISPYSNSKHCMTESISCDASLLIAAKRCTWMCLCPIIWLQCYHLSSYHVVNANHYHHNYRIAWTTWKFESLILFCN